MTASVNPVTYPAAQAVTDARIPTSDRVVTRDLMERWNREQPERCS